MAPLAPSNTPRFRVHYATVGGDHTMQIRSASSPLAIGAFVAGFWTALGAASSAKVVSFVDFAPAGSDIFNPVATTLDGNTYGSGSVVSENYAWAYTFVGRTPGGRRVRLVTFLATDLGANYRFSAGEDGNIDAAVAVLVAAGGLVVGIDGLTPVWKSYVNVQVNDHWVKVLR